MPNFFAVAFRKQHLHLGVLFLALVYSAQLWSPLRLTGDSVELLSIASSAAHGIGFVDHGHRTHYFPGYPAMVACMDKLHIATPLALVALNGMFLVVALFAARYIAGNYFALASEWSLATVLLTCLSFALIKHFTLPLTDVPFMGISLAALAFLVKAERQTSARYYSFWGGALVLTIAAVAVRPIGIALLLSLAWSLSTRLNIWKRLREQRAWRLSSYLAFCGIFCIGAKILSQTKYVQEALGIFHSGGLLRPASKLLLYRLHEIGEISLNVPASKLGPLAPLVFVAGVTVTVLTLKYARLKGGRAVELYLAAYVSILFLWPYGDTRFWTPILPLVFAKVFSIMRPWAWRGWRRTIAISYAGIYVFAGVAALTYSTWITFSGRAFADRFGDDHLRPTYQLFYGHSKVDLSKVDQSALALLTHYSR